MALPEPMWEGLFLQYRKTFENSSNCCNDYHYGVFISVVGSIIGRKLHLYYARDLYPNFYTVLEGPTGISRKTAAMRFGYDILQQFPEVKKSWGISSAEGLIRLMGGGSVDDDIDTKPTGKSTMIVMEELASLLRKGKQESLTNLTPTLTNLYDNPHQIDLPTRKRPLVVYSPFISIMSGTTYDWLASSLSEEEVMGGFANRFMYIRGMPKAPISLPPKPSKDDVTAIVLAIKYALSNIKSDYITLNTEAALTWDKFYTSWVKQKREGIIAEMVQRIPEYALKCALINAFLEGKKQIEKKDMSKGIMFAIFLEQNIDDIYGSFPLSQWGKTEAKIIQLLKEQNPRSKRDIHQHISGRVAADRLNRIIQGLEANEMITSITIGGKTYLKLIKDTKSKEEYGGLNEQQNGTTN